MEGRSSERRAKRVTRVRREKERETREGERSKREERGRARGIFSVPLYPAITH